MHEDSFLQAIAENPADDTLRLVYADWLDERGDPRGEYLRCAVAVQNAPKDAPDFPAHVRQLQQLRPAAPAWVRRTYPRLAEDDVRELVFKTILGVPNERVDVFEFVMVDDAQPSPYLMTMLQEQYGKLVPTSHAEFIKTNYRRQPRVDYGMLASVDQLKWSANDQCCIWGGYAETWQIIPRTQFRIGIEQDRWAVIERWDGIE